MSPSSHAWLSRLDSTQGPLGTPSSRQVSVEKGLLFRRAALRVPGEALLAGKVRRITLAVSLADELVHAVEDVRVSQRELGRSRLAALGYPALCRSARARCRSCSSSARRCSCSSSTRWRSACSAAGIWRSNRQRSTAPTACTRCAPSSKMGSCRRRSARSQTAATSAASHASCARTLRRGSPSTRGPPWRVRIPGPNCASGSLGTSTVRPATLRRHASAGVVRAPPRPVRQRASGSDTATAACVGTLLAVRSGLASCMGSCLL